MVRRVIDTLALREVAVQCPCVRASPVAHFTSLVPEDSSGLFLTEGVEPCVGLNLCLI